MATTLKSSLVQDKIAELTKTIAALKTDESISKNTRGTQLYARGRERRVLRLIGSLIEAVGDDFQFNEDDAATFALITTLSTERKLTKYEFHEGELVIDVLERYENLNRKTLEERLSKIGLAIDYETKTIVKA